VGDEAIRELALAGEEREGGGGEGEMDQTTKTAAVGGRVQCWDHAPGACGGRRVAGGASRPGGQVFDSWPAGPNPLRAPPRARRNPAPTAPKTTQHGSMDNWRRRTGRGSGRVAGAGGGGRGGAMSVNSRAPSLPPPRPPAPPRRLGGAALLPAPLSVSLSHRQPGARRLPNRAGHVRHGGGEAVRGRGQQGEEGEAGEHDGESVELGLERGSRGRARVRERGGDGGTEGK
jgi:hypothetical protein